MDNSNGVSRDQLKALGEVFDPIDIEWRIGQTGKKGDKPWARAFAYITNRAVMERLDRVCGPENWKNEFKPAPNGEGVICGVSIRVDRGNGASEWVTKWDGADNTEAEAIKGGLSSAMKRAVVQWGMGRYLYKLEQAFVKIHDKGKNWSKEFRWDPPDLPDFALPKSAVKAEDAEAGLNDSLSTIKRLAEYVPDDYKTNIEGRSHSLKEWTRTNWPRLKNEPKLAREIATLFEQVE